MQITNKTGKFYKYGFFPVLVICLMFLPDFSLAPGVWGQGAVKPAPKAAAKKGKVDPKDKAAADAQDEANAAAQANLRWNPELALLGTLALPLGDAGKILDMGFGGKADITTHIPALKFLKQKSFDLRPGFFGGYQLNPVKAAVGGNFSTIPAVLYAAIDFTTISPSFVPYFAVGSGVAMSAASATGVSSVDAVLYVAGGAKIYLGKERRLFIKGEVAFFMAWEEVSGMFIQGNLGMGYRL